MKFPCRSVLFQTKLTIKGFVLITVKLDPKETSDHCYFILNIDYHHIWLKLKVDN